MWYYTPRELVYFRRIYFRFNVLQAHNLWCETFRIILVPKNKLNKTNLLHVLVQKHFIKVHIWYLFKKTYIFQWLNCIWWWKILSRYRNFCLFFWDKLNFEKMPLDRCGHSVIWKTFLDAFSSRYRPEKAHMESTWPFYTGIKRLRRPLLQRVNIAALEAFPLD